MENPKAMEALKQEIDEILAENTEGETCTLTQEVIEKMKVLGIYQRSKLTCRKLS